jgi:hypothetical protein
MTRRANLPCGCGSGKPYKRCHRDKDKGMQELFRKIQAGELPITAQMRSENSEPSSMQVGRIVVTHGGVERVLSEEMLTLTTNTVPGDKTQKSMARVSLPVDGSMGSISTFGNATVCNGALPLNLRLSGGSKKLKASSHSGGFAVARIGRHNDTQQEFFDFLFGYDGQSEVVDGSGRKNRSHVALHPDGNGRFLRLEGNGCEIATEQGYTAAANSIVPRKVVIRSPQFTEILVAEFTASGETVELVSIAFETDQ